MCLCVWKVSPMLNINSTIDSFSSYSKFELLKVKVVKCISAKLAFKLVLFWRWKISNKNYNACLVSESLKK